MTMTRVLLTPAGCGEATPCRAAPRREASAESPPRKNRAAAVCWTAAAITHPSVPVIGRALPHATREHDGGALVWLRKNWRSSATRHWYERVNPERLVEIASDVVSAAQRQLPPMLRSAAQHVIVHYERVPADDVLADGFEPDILGLFAGDPHGAEFAHDQPSAPHILLYLQNVWDYAGADENAFREEVRTTFLHELGHYFGWDEDDLAARGLD